MGKPLGSSFSSPLQDYCRPTGSLGCGPLVPQVVVGMITLLVGGSGLLGNHSTGVTECHCSSHGRLGCVTVTNIPKPMAPVWASNPAKVALHDLQAEVLLTRSGLRKMVQPEEDGERTSSPSPGIPGTERRCRCAWLMAIHLSTEGQYATLQERGSSGLFAVKVPSGLRYACCILLLKNLSSEKP